MMILYGYVVYLTYEIAYHYSLLDMIMYTYVYQYKLIDIDVLVRAFTKREARGYLRTLRLSGSKIFSKKITKSG